MKKALKILGIILLILIIGLITAPFLFQNKIKDIVKNVINENVNAKVEFSDVDLSFLKSFPKANVTISDLAITTFAPFEGDTLASVKTVNIDLSIKELFKKETDDPIAIQNIEIDKALANILVNENGQNNYNIAKDNKNTPDQTENTSTSESNGGFKFNINIYKLSNATLNYIDQSSKNKLSITKLNHSGSAKISSEVSELDTNTEANVSFSQDSTNYLNNNRLKLDAIIDLDLPNSTYTFKENKALINNLPLEFNGFVKLLDAGQEIDISFANPGSDFKDFLALVPETYSKNLDDVSTSGTFKINGKVNGMLTENTIPKLDINILSNNASFKYPNLPKTVKNIEINTKIKNETGNLDDTFVDLKTLNFKIDEDAFKSSATLKNLTKNILVNANIDGVLNLENLTQAYPIEIDSDLKGVLKGKINTNFDMNAIETNAYERIKADGDMALSNFVYTSKEMNNPVQISQANLEFNPSKVNLKQFNATSGKSDFSTKGTIDNLLGFVLNNQKLKGNFNLTSNTFSVNDFMVQNETSASESANSETSTPATTSGQLKIPEFLDANISAKAKTVIYDNLNLKNVTGNLTIKDQKAELKNVSSDLFGGKILVAGAVSTKTEKPVFNLDLGIDKFNISESFKAMELLQFLAPVAGFLEGKLNTKINISGGLNSDLSPDLNTVSGSALAEVLAKTFEPKAGGVADALTSQLNFIDFSKLDLKNLKTKVEFKDGKVNVKPFNINYKDIAIKVVGSHSFSDNIDYKLELDVPAKYLGNEVNSLIAKIDDNAVKNITIPVTANITGMLNSPKVSTDLTSGVKTLTNKLIEIQKQKLINKGKDELNNIIGDVLGGNSSETDSTKTNPVTDVLGGILGGNTQQDSTKTEDTTPKATDVLNDILSGNTTKTDTTKADENIVNDVLGGIFGKKKKKEVVKDSVN